MLSVEELDRSLELLQDHWSHLRSLRVLPRDTGYTELILEAFNSAILAHPDCIMEDIYFNIGIRGDNDDPNVDYGEDNPDIVPYLLLPASQMLRSVELRGFNLYPVHPHPATALLGLRKLTLAQTSEVFLSNGLVALLSIMPNLKDLWVYEFRRSVDGEEFPDMIDASTITSIPLPNLESLYLADLPGAVVNQLLRKLDMPNLWSFGFHTDFIHWMGTKMDWDAISRPRRLRSLSLKGVLAEQASPVVSWLKTLDDLEKLEISPDMMGSEPEFAEAMAGQLIKAAYCPKFKTLYLHFHPPSRLRMYLRALTATRPSMSLEVFA